MGGKQSKRSVDITTTPKKGEENATGIGEGEGRVEKIEDLDQLKVSANGGVHTEIEIKDKEKSESKEAIVNGTGENGVSDSEESKTPDKTPDTEKSVSDEISEEKAVQKSTESIDEKAEDSTPEQKKAKKEKGKRKWSFRSISFTKKDKSKPNKDEIKNGDVKDVLPEEVANVEDSPKVNGGDLPAENEVQTNGIDTVESPKEEKAAEPTIATTTVEPTEKPVETKPVSPVASPVEEITKPPSPLPSPVETITTESIPAEQPVISEEKPIEPPVVVNEVTSSIPVVDESLEKDAVVAITPEKEVPASASTNAEVVENLSCESSALTENETDASDSCIDSIIETSQIVAPLVHTVLTINQSTLPVSEIDPATLNVSQEKVVEVTVDALAESIGAIQIKSDVISVEPVDAIPVEESVETVAEKSVKSITEASVDTLEKSDTPAGSEILVQSPIQTKEVSETFENKIVDQVNSAPLEEVETKEDLVEPQIESEALADEPISETISETISESLPDPVSESLPDPISESLPDPISESLPDPISESLPDPISESLPDPISESLPEPVSESLPDPISPLAESPIREEAPITEELVCALNTEAPLQNGTSHNVESESIAETDNIDKLESVAPVVPLSNGNPIESSPIEKMNSHNIPEPLAEKVESQQEESSLPLPATLNDTVPVTSAPLRDESLLSNDLAPEIKQANGLPAEEIIASENKLDECRGDVPKCAPEKLIENDAAPPAVTTEE